MSARRVSDFYFKPDEETVWPAPDAEALPPLVLQSAWAAYVQLLTHPCGEQMLRKAREGWAELQEDEHGRRREDSHTGDSQRL